LVRFPTTRWSVVLAAQDADPERAAEALASLCEAYWLPLYAYVRHQGHSPDAASDVVQAYFTHLLEKRLVRIAHSDAGRLRGFFLHTLKLFLTSERERAAAVRRGSQYRMLSLDVVLAEKRYHEALVDRSDPEREYRRHWAIAVTERVKERLVEELKRGGRADEFRSLEPYLTGHVERGAYRLAAARTGKSEVAVRVAVRRLRQRYGALLRDEIALTVADPGEVDDEIRALLEALR
jgi:RNA polymerase sigma-70 factor (ECF subfamily)